jgi:hypothetical protein
MTVFRTSFFHECNRNWGMLSHWHLHHAVQVNQHFRDWIIIRLLILRTELPYVRTVTRGCSWSLRRWFAWTAWHSCQPKRIFTEAVFLDRVFNSLDTPMGAAQTHQCRPHLFQGYALPHFEFLYPNTVVTVDLCQLLSLTDILSTCNMRQHATYDSRCTAPLGLGCLTSPWL